MIQKVSYHSIFIWDVGGPSIDVVLTTFKRLFSDDETELAIIDDKV
jgi:hypothetical protein